MYVHCHASGLIQLINVINNDAKHTRCNTLLADLSCTGLQAQRSPHSVLWSQEPSEAGNLQNLEELKVADLKQICLGRGLMVSGTKAQLIERIMAASHESSHDDVAHGKDRHVEEPAVHSVSQTHDGADLSQTREGAETAASSDVLVTESIKGEMVNGGADTSTGEGEVSCNMCGTRLMQVHS